MKVIDLLNKIANGEEQEDNKYQFSYVDYCTIREFFDRYIVDEENLNLEILEDKVEDKKIEKLKTLNASATNMLSNVEITLDIRTLKNKINEIIDYLEENKE